MEGEASKRIAVVTGANQGIGLEIVKQLASNGIMVLLTAIDEKRGTEAVEMLKDSGFSDVVSHQLDVSDTASIATLADFIKTQFGKLDILVNNAAVLGILLDLQDLDSSTKESMKQGGLPVFLKLLAAAVQDYEKAEECLNINYYGTKKVIDALMPLLQLSHSPRIVNISSEGGKLQRIPSERIRREFSDVDGLSEEKLDELLQQFLSDFKAKNLEEHGWPTILSAYMISKVALNALTRILSKKYPKVCINCVHPGFVKTDITFNTGTETVEQGAKEYSKNMEGEASKRIAVVTGANRGIGLEIVKQLASNGIMVLLTARDEKRGNEAVEKLKDSGFSDVVFHQLDVSDGASIASLADFIKTEFGKLDILVNNAAVSGISVDLQDLDSSTKESIEQGGLPGFFKLLAAAVEDYERAEECLNINYYGAKNIINALLPLLQLSFSPRIVNVSSGGGKLQHIPSESIRREFGDADDLNEDKLDELLQRFLSDFKAKNLEENGWPTILSAYIISKAALNALTRILAKKYPKFCINCVHPGYVNTEMNFKTGTETVEEGAKGPVMLALFPDGGPSGFFYDHTSVSSFE
ncbi:Short-chain dehydrogenase/reductase SDR protein [Dioscorea alata]|uniref:Short-chain dehydrogenase/reductase SDR protein n=1 Tax=Dioscorea alata TaxID=55571 RepID=A0ACB7UR11_DIOAL|nr:Short-chain dehydrogenase/reductase SDR protein [Dioscorea alata]